MKVDRILLVFLGLVGFCETIKAPSKFRGAGLRKPNKFKAGKSSGSQTSLISRSSKRTILKSPPKSTVALIKDWALGVTTTVSFSSLLGVIFDQITDALEKEPTTMAEVGGKFREISKLFKSLKTALSENDKKDDEKIGTNFLLFFHVSILCGKSEIRVFNFFRSSIKHKPSCCDINAMLLDNFLGYVQVLKDFPCSVKYCWSCFRH